MEKRKNKRISVRKIFSVSSKVILGLIIAFLVFVAGTLTYDKFIKKSAIPSFFGNSVLVIATPSMSGSIETGDMIIIKKSGSYEVGDVITYFPASETTSVTHRIVRIEGEKFFTKGDANESEDPDPVFITQIVGKMTGRIPKMGIVIEWLRTWQGILFMVAVGAVIVAIVMIAGGSDEDETPEEAYAVENVAVTSESGDLSAPKDILKDGTGDNDDEET